MPDFSAFTASHRPDGLASTYQSLLAQPEDWEWVVVTNRGGSVPESIARDPRVVVRHADASGGIGHLKRTACSHARGDILVELDHDDRLLPGCLRRVGEAVAGGAGFVYSDWLEVDDAGRDAPVFAPGHGWDYYPFDFEGATYRARAAFDVTPSSLFKIEYCPNHARAWQRDAYWKAGGHDPALRIGDDHDLVCRTYLAGIPFAHVPEPLYLYRARGGVDRNTSTREVDSLAEARAALTEKYTHPLVDRWCVDRGLLRVDLGALHGKPGGFVGVDLEAGHGVDVIADVRHGLPFDDDSVGRLRAHDFLEHLAPGKELVNFWNECFRVIAPGGWFTSLTPSESGLGGSCDPTHLSKFNMMSHRYVTDRAAQSYVRGLTARFQAARVMELYPSAWHRDSNIPYLRMDLVALKGQRQPGPVGF